MATISDLIKEDGRPAWAIAEMAGLHQNTVYKFRAGYEPIDYRGLESMEEIARIFGYRVKVTIELEPINGSQN